MNCDYCAIDSCCKDTGEFCLGKSGFSKKQSASFFRKGQTVHVQGHPVFGVYFVKSGKLKISTIGASGKESIVRMAKKGDVVGIRALLAGELLQATITAVEDSETCFFSKDEVLTIMKEYPEVASQILQRLASMLGNAEKTIVSLMQDSVKTRYANLLLSFSNTYGIVDYQAGRPRRKIDLKLTREEIASIVGTTPETITRLTTEFRKDNLIDVENKYFFISDFVALEDVGRGLAQ